jgi:hypothetical protein
VEDSAFREIVVSFSDWQQSLLHSQNWLLWLFPGLLTKTSNWWLISFVIVPQFFAHYRRRWFELYWKKRVLWQYHCHCDDASESVSCYLARSPCSLGEFVQNIAFVSYLRLFCDSAFHCDDFLPFF